MTDHRHTLLIGIDRYPKLAERYQLRGCVNDVRSLRQLLIGCLGFPSDEVTVLENAAATRDGILGAFENLRQQIRPEDAVVVAYSGHGSRVKKSDGSWSEAIVPHDSGRDPHPNRDIRDDEIYQWLLDWSDITPRITLIFDSCYSGSVVRDPFAARVRWVEPDPRPVPARAGPSLRRGPSGWLPLSDRYVLLAACRHDESAFEIEITEGGRAIYHGALAYFLQREVRIGEPDLSYRDLFERVRPRVTAAFPSQHPQIEGALDRELFGGRTLETMSFLSVLERRESRVLLAGGVAHGLTARSEWVIYPQGTRSVTSETPRLGLAVVGSVGAVTAECDLLEEEGARSVQAGDRAVEHAHDHGEMRLVVDVPGEADDPELAGLRAALSGSSLLRVAGPGDVAHAHIRRKADEAVWVCTGDDGEWIIPACRVAESGSIDRLARNLEKLARHRLVLGIENHDPESRLKGKIDVRLLRRLGGEWRTAELAEPGDILYRDSDWLGLEIANRSGVPVYVSVLNPGVGGGISLLHPVHGANEELSPGGSLQIGVRRGQETELFIPREFPFKAPGGPAQGTEFVKVFATTQEADFSPLLQTGYRRSAGIPASLTGMGPLGRLFEAAMAGRGSRETRPVIHSPGADWTTVTRSFLLRRA